MGRELAAAIRSGAAGDASLVALFDEKGEQASTLSQQIGGSVPYTTVFDGFVAAAGLHFVVECASPSAARAYAERVLAGGKDLMMMSSGALADLAFLERLTDLAQEVGRRLIVPSGALGGIDAIKAVRGQLEEVTLTTTKPPRALVGAPGFKEWEHTEITEPQVVFHGPALEAISLFPANVNVGATLTLAGIGPHRTMVKVVADPHSSANVHEVYAVGGFGVLRFRLELRPHPRNPRTSALAVYSAIETLRSACSSGPRIGT